MPSLCSARGARDAAHLLQGDQDRRGPADRPPGRAGRRHPHRPRGAFPRKRRGSMLWLWRRLAAVPHEPSSVCRSGPPLTSSCVRPRTSAGSGTASSPWSCWAEPTRWSSLSPPSGTSSASSVSLCLIPEGGGCRAVAPPTAVALTRSLSPRRRLCCCHAHLHPALGFLHQTGQEGIHEVCAKDRGKTSSISQGLLGNSRQVTHIPPPPRLPPFCSVVSWS